MPNSTRFIRTFSRGKQELDVDDKFIPAGSYRYGRNIEVANSESSDAGVVQSVRGNRAHRPTDFTIDPTNVTIGQFADNVRNKIYWFWVGATNEGIYEFNLADNTVHRIIEFSRDRRELRFSIDNLITGINKIGDLLYWVDGVSPTSNRPRRINVERFRGSEVNPRMDNDGIIVSPIIVQSGTGNIQITPAFDDDLLSVARRPPLSAPNLVNPHSNNNYGTPGTTLYETMPAFAYRYIYREGEVSAIGKFTQGAFFPENYSVSRDSGILTSMVNRYNAIDIMFDVGGTEVVEVEILFKQSGSNSIHSLATINKADNNLLSSSPYQRRFSSVTYDANKVYRTLPSDEITRVYDAVPLKALAQEFVGNRLVYGNYVENYPLTVETETGAPIVPDFELTFVATPKNETDLSPSKTCKSDRYYEAAITYHDRYGVSSDAIIPRNSGSGATNTVFIPIANSGDRNRLQLEIRHRAPYWATHYTVNIKDTRGAFYNIFPQDIVVDSDNNLAYLRIPSLDDADTVDETTGVSSTINKVATDDIIILKSYSKADIRDAEVERREFRVTEVGFINSDDNMSITEDGVYITISPIVATDLADIPTDSEVRTTTIWETVPSDADIDLFYPDPITFRCENGIHTSSTDEIIRIDDPKQTIVYNENGDFVSIDSVTLTVGWFNAFSYSNGCESMHVRDEFFGVQLEKGARATTVTDEYRQRDLTNNLIHSGVYVDDVDRNRLSEFNPTFPISTDLDINNGSIQKLYARDTNLIVFQEDKIVTIPIDSNLIQTVGGQGTLTVDSSFFGREFAVSENYGISTNPESFAQYGAAVYFADAHRGVLCRLDGSGVNPISNRGLETLTRLDTRVAPIILGGFDEYQQRMFFSLKNRSVAQGIGNSSQFQISSTGCSDPQAECQRDTRLIDFRPVHVVGSGNTIGVGSVIFVDRLVDNVGALTTFNGQYRWYRIRNSEAGQVTFDQVIQISPDGVVTSLINSCSTSYPAVIRHRLFNITSERFNDEYDACANGIIDSVAYSTTDTPTTTNTIYEGRFDLIPSSRTGWYLIRRSDGLHAINVIEGVIVERVPCEEIALGRRRIQGSNPLPTIMNESAFDRNLRLCLSNVSVREYFWIGEKDRPEVGDVLYTNNIQEDALATPSRYYVFDDGYFVLLDAMSAVISSGSCFDRVCTNEINAILTQSSTNDLMWTYNGDTVFLNAEVEWLIRGDSRYPSSGVFTSTFDRLNPNSSITLELPDGIRVTESMNDRSVIIQRICYRRNNITASSATIHINPTANTDTGVLCGSTATMPLYFNQTDLIYFTDSAMTPGNEFSGTGLYGVSLTGVNMAVTHVYQFTGNGIANVSGTIFCDFRHPLMLSYDADNGQESCTTDTALYYADNAGFSTSVTNPPAATRLIVSDGLMSDVPNGFYSNKTVIRQQSATGLGNNTTSPCITLNSISATFGATAQIACHSGTSDDIFTDNNAFNAQTTQLFETAGYTGRPASGFYVVNNMVGEWNAQTGVFTFLNACPVQLPLFAFATWTGSVRVDPDGSIVFTPGNAASVSNTPPAQDFDPVTADTQRIVNITIEVPAGFRNTGQTVTGSREVTQNPPTFAFSDWTGSASVAANGTITINRGNATAATNTPAQTFEVVRVATPRNVNIRLTVPTGFSNSGMMISGTFPTTQPLTSFPPFTQNDWTGEVSITRQGVITVSRGNSSTTPTFTPASFNQNNASDPVTQTVRVTITTPTSGNFANLNTSLTFNVQASQPGTGLPTWGPSAWTGSIDSITQGGIVSIDRGNAGSVMITSQIPSGANTGNSARDVTVSATVNAPSAGYALSPAARSFTASETLSQPGLPTFAFSDWTGSASVAADGTISFVNGNSGAAVTNTPAQTFGVVRVITPRSVNARVTIPSGFFNAGQTVDGTTPSNQPATSLNAFAFSDWSGSITINAAGVLNITNGNSPMVVNSPVQTFSRVSTAINRTINAVVTVPAGFSNSGMTVSGTVTDRQEATEFTISAATSGVDLTWDYAETTSRTIAVTTTPDNGQWSVTSSPDRWTAIKSGNNVVITSLGGIATQGHTGNVVLTHSQDSSDTVSIGVTIEAEPINYDISSEPTSLSFEGTANTEEVLTITTTPDAGAFSYAATNSWINVRRVRGQLFVNVEDFFATFGTRTGSVIVTHSEDSTEIVRITITQQSSRGQQ